MRIFTTLLILQYLFCLLPLPAMAASDSRKIQATSTVRASGEKRVALVIGNSAYRHTNRLSYLRNPVNDAEDIAKVLKGFGFKVIEKKNLTKEQMEDAITEFGREISNSDAALFYFSGHGLQVKNANYLAPIDSKSDSEAQAAHQNIHINQVLDEMENSKSRVNIVMLDACRNNPITGKYKSGGTKGLAPLSGAPKDTVIVYATAPGDVASDGDGRNGVFTTGLLTAFNGNDLSLGGVLARASEVVEETSQKMENKRQVPYVNGPPTIQKNFYFIQTSGPVTVQQGASANHAGDAEREAWGIVKDSADPADLKDFLEKFPNGQYANTARIKLRQLEKKQSATAAASRAEQQRLAREQAEAQRRAQAAEERSRAEAAERARAEVASRPAPVAPVVASSSRGFTDPTTGMEFVSVPGGCFQMGDTFGNGSSDEIPVHEVCVSSFMMGTYEVTQGQWKKVMGSNPSSFRSCGDNCPVEQVSWNDAQEFIKELNQQSGKSYRLPTEAEWEYAAREGGKKVRFGTGSNTISASSANFDARASFKKSYSEAGE